MRLLIDETFATAAFTAPIFARWMAPLAGWTIEIVPRLTADAIAAEDVALATSAEALWRHDTHRVLPHLAVAADGVGAIAMRTPVRPDEIESSPVLLREASRTAELLARATLHPFYGIGPTGWTRNGDDAESAAEVVIVEGAEALRDVEAGFSEDLVRAWFIMTANPVVTHLLLAPKAMAADDLVNLTAWLTELRDIGMRRRGEWIPDLANREDVPPAKASAFWAAQRFSLTPADREALRALWREGIRGTSGPNPASVEFPIETTGS